MKTKRIFPKIKKEEKIQKLGFIGVGIIDKPLVKILIRVGYKITAYYINPEVLKEIVAFREKKEYNKIEWCHVRGIRE